MAQGTRLEPRPLVQAGGLSWPCSGSSILLVLFSFPTSGNISWPFMAVTVLLLVVYYFGWARSRFQGPKVQGAEGELTEIEREFQDAAKGLGTP